MPPWNTERTTIGGAPSASSISTTTITSSSSLVDESSMSHMVITSLANLVSSLFSSSSSSSPSSSTFDNNDQSSSSFDFSSATVMDAANRAGRMFLRANSYSRDNVEVIDTGGSDLWVVGLSVFFVSQILINLGQNVVRLSHTRNHRILWFAGLLFFLLGNMGSFSALNLAPQSTLEGLGAVQFLSNLIFAYRVLGERILVRHAVSTTFIIAGNVLLVTFGSHTNRVVNAEEILVLVGRPAFVGYMIASYLLALILQSTAFFKPKLSHGKLQVIASSSHEVHPGVYAVVSALIGGNSVLLGKACMGLIGQSLAHAGEMQRLTRTPGQPSERDVIAVAVVLWIIHIAWWSYRLNIALKKFAALFVIPALQAIWIISTVLSGGIFFEEFSDFSAQRSCIFGFGLLLVLFGVLALCKDQSPTPTARGNRRAGVDHWLNRPMSGRHCAANCDEGLELVRLDSVVVERNELEGTGLLVDPEADDVAKDANGNVLPHYVGENVSTGFGSNSSSRGGMMSPQVTVVNLYHHQNENNNNNNNNNAPTSGRRCAKCGGCFAGGAGAGVFDDSQQQQVQAANGGRRKYNNNNDQGGGVFAMIMNSLRDEDENDNSVNVNNNNNDDDIEAQKPVVCRCGESNGTNFRNALSSLETADDDIVTQSSVLSAASTATSAGAFPSPSASFLYKFVTRQAGPPSSSSSSRSLQYPTTSNNNNNNSNGVAATNVAVDASSSSSSSSSTASDGSVHSIAIAHTSSSSSTPPSSFPSSPDLSSLGGGGSRQVSRDDEILLLHHHNNRQQNQQRDDGDDEEEAGYGNWTAFEAA